MTTHFVRPDTEAFLNYLNAVPGPKINEMPLSEARNTMMAMRHVADAPTGPLAVIRNLECPGPAGPIRLRLYDPRESRAAGPAMVFFHGGGFVVGDLDSHEPFCAEAARVLDMPVIAVDYRLAPENPWPAAPDDCEAAARWVASSPPELGRTITGLVTCGDSAGGSLTIVTTMSLRDEPAAVPVLVQAPIYPAADLGVHYPSYDDFAEGYLLSKGGMEWFNDCYLADMDHVRASPLRGNHRDMPPSVIVTASLDPIRDQGRAYAAALVQAGVNIVYQEAAGNIHGFINMRKAIPSSATDIARLLAAIQSLMVAA